MVPKSNNIPLMFPINQVVLANSDTGQYLDVCLSDMRDYILYSIGKWYSFSIYPVQFLHVLFSTGVGGVVNLPLSIATE